MAVPYVFFDTLRNDQSSGAQSDGDKNDLAIDSTFTATDGGDPRVFPALFKTFLDSIGLSGAQTAFAADVEAAQTDDPMFTIDPDGEAKVTSVRFTDKLGGTLAGDAEDATTLTDLAGNTIYLYEFMDGRIVIGSTEDRATIELTGAVTDISNFDTDQIMFAGYLEVDGLNTTSADGTITWVTFGALDNPLTGLNGTNHDDPIDSATPCISAIAPNF
jgi:hypothetical protein